MKNKLKPWLIASAITNIILLLVAAISITLLLTEKNSTVETLNVSNDTVQYMDVSTTVTEMLGYSNLEIPYFCNVGSLNVRKEPSQTSEKIGTLLSSQEITVWGFYNEWALIEYDDSYSTKYGYVKVEYIEEK